MNQPVLIDEHDDESIYRFQSDNGYKYLFKIVDNKNYFQIDYFERQQWNHLVSRKTHNRKYLVKLACTMLNSLPDNS